jgi:hypothetical protein
MTPTLEKLVIIMHGREEESRENDLNYYRGDLRQKKSEEWLRLRKKAYWGEGQVELFRKAELLYREFLKQREGDLYIYNVE